MTFRALPKLDMVRITILDDNTRKLMRKPKFSGLRWTAISEKEKQRNAVNMNERLTMTTKDIKINYKWANRGTENTNTVH